MIELVRAVQKCWGQCTWFTWQLLSFYGQKSFQCWGGQLSTDKLQPSSISTDGGPASKLSAKATLQMLRAVCTKTNSKATTKIISNSTLLASCISWMERESGIEYSSQSLITCFRVIAVGSPNVKGTAPIYRIVDPHTNHPPITLVSKERRGQLESVLGSHRIVSGALPPHPTGFKQSLQSWNQTSIRSIHHFENAQRNSALSNSA